MSQEVEFSVNKEEFLESRGLQSEFIRSGYTWEELMHIAAEYDRRRREVYPKIIERYISNIATFKGIHSYRFRIKETESFIGKLIIKASKDPERKVTIDTYEEEITDLLGIRVLYMFQEEYLLIHNQLMDAYKGELCENVHIKLKKGDDKGFYKGIRDPFYNENHVYRSIHYTLRTTQKSKGITYRPKLEIQTRTIFEEGWSEINHQVVYKQKVVEGSEVLEILSKILSDLVSECNEVASLMNRLHQQYQVSDDNRKLESDKLEESTLIADIINDFLRK